MIVIQFLAEILGFRELIFQNAPIRDHAAVRFFTFGKEDLELMCNGTVDYMFEDGSTHAREWAARYEIVKVGNGELKFKRVQIFAVSTN